MLSKVSALITRAQEYTKFWVAVVGGVLFIVSDNLALPEEVLTWVKVGIAIATAFSVYQFPNVPQVPGESPEA